MAELALINYSLISDLILKLHVLFVFSSSYFPLKLPCHANIIENNIYISNINLNVVATFELLICCKIILRFIQESAIKKFKENYTGTLESSLSFPLLLHGRGTILSSVREITRIRKTINV